MQHLDTTTSALAICLLGIAASVAHAEHGRDFSATYSLGSPHVADASHVTVPIALSLRNHSGADLANATVELGRPLTRAAPARRAVTLSPSATPAVTLANHAAVSVTILLTVTNREYQRWQSGGRPLLALSTRDANGHRVVHPMEAKPSLGSGARP